MKTGFIYGLRCPLSGEIRYVGQTLSTLKKRLKGHKFDRRHNPHKVNWIKKLEKLELLDLLEIEILEECVEEQLNEKERFWIQKFKDDGNKLVNLTDGGDTNYRVDADAIKRSSEKLKGMFIGRKLSDETKEKISKKHKGKKLSEEHKKSISDGLTKAYNENRKNTIITDEQKKKISLGLIKFFLENPRPKQEKIKTERKIHIYTKEEKEKRRKNILGTNNPFYGKKHTMETKKMIGEKNREHMMGKKNHFYGKKHSEETKEKIANKLMERPKKIYYIYDENFLFIIKGTSVELLDFFKIKRSENISRFCNKNKKYKNYFIFDTVQNKSDLHQI